MKLVSLKEMLKHAQENCYAVGAFSYCNAETAQAVVETGISLRSPVILITEIPLLGAKFLVQMAESLASGTDVPVCVHLDHATDLDLVRENA